MSFDFVESFCCIFLHGFYFIFLVFVYFVPFLLFKINNALFLRHQYLFASVPVSLTSYNWKFFVKKVLWDSDMVLGKTLWRALVIFFSCFIITIIIVFFENLAKISDNPFWIICDLEDAYFVKRLLMVASEILTYSKICNPL